MSKFIHLSLILALVLVASVSWAQMEAYDVKLEEAETLFVDRDYAGAVKSYRKAQKLAGGPTFECCYGLAKSFVKLGAYKNGVESARQALPLAQDVDQKLRTYNLLGLGLFANGNAETAQLEEAVAVFEKVLEISDSLPPDQQSGTDLVRYNLGVSLLKLERDDEGVARLREFLDSAPVGKEARLAESYVDNSVRARVPMMPELDVVTLDGEFLTSEDLAGKVVLIDFWATWCSPCVASIPHLRRLSRRYEDDPFVLLSVSADSDGQKLRSFVAEHRMTWLQVWDEDRHLRSHVFKISGYPTYILVDHTGEIVYRSGWASMQRGELNSQVTRALRNAKKAGKE